MSFDYWNMKLMGGAVYYHDVVQLIETMEFDEDMWEHNPPAGRFPEDYLPYIQFGLTQGDVVNYTDFEIRFPDDQWFLNKDGRASCLSRRMTRQYKIAPNADLFNLTHDDPFLTVMACCDQMPRKYSNPHDLFEWSQDDKVFSKRVALRRTSRTQRMLMYYETPIAKMTRGKTWIKLTPLVELMPSVVDKWWGSKMDVKVEAPEDTTVPTGAQLDTLHYRWTKVPTVGSHAGPGHPYYYFTNMDDGWLVFTIPENGRRIFITSRHQIDILFMDAQLSRTIRNDMISIFVDEMGDEEYEDE